MWGAELPEPLPPLRYLAASAWRVRLWNGHPVPAGPVRAALALVRRDAPEGAPVSRLVVVRPILGSGEALWPSARCTPGLDLDPGVYGVSVEVRHRLEGDPVWAGFREERLGPLGACALAPEARRGDVAVACDEEAARGATALLERYLLRAGLRARAAPPGETPVLSLADGAPEGAAGVIRIQGPRGGLSRFPVADWRAAGPALALAAADAARSLALPQHR